ncbi:Glycerophosphodiester phosphodiesterase GDPD2 [Raphanus sativus]|nr:Glycerophosphodiester phosphodiesterase GDPD2 [Raphanus sativus]
MALRTVLVAYIPSLPDSVYGLAEGMSPSGLDLSKPKPFKMPGFSVIGHRGNGMNVLQSSDRRTRGFKENSILSFNSAAKFVTKDDCPVIFHDDFIYSQENGVVNESRVTDLSLSEFLLYGPQKEAEKSGKTLMRKSKEGQVLRWDVDSDDPLCTLQEAFERVERSLGFNIELKFDDQVVYEREFLVHVLRTVLQVVFDYAKDRPVIFSSFQPDAAQLVRELQSTYPVFFLTNAGNQMYNDERRNSLEEAIKVCLEGKLQGIVSEVKGVFRNPSAISKIKESNLSLLTYGKLNNVGEAVYMQYVMGIEGVIVDFVEEISESVTLMMIRSPSPSSGSKDDVAAINTRPEFSQKEIDFLLRLLSQF